MLISNLCVFVLTNTYVLISLFFKPNTKTILYLQLQNLPIITTPKVILFFRFIGFSILPLMTTLMQHYMMIMTKAAVIQL